MRQKYKNDGYAIWFMLLEHLGKADYHYLDLKNPVQMMYLSSEFMVEEITLKAIIDDLVKLDEFDKELWENESILYNQDFVDSIEDAYKKRNNDCIDKNSLLLLLLSKGRLKQPKSNPKPPKSNLKGDDNHERIGKKRIGKEIHIPIYEDFKKYALEKQSNTNLHKLRLKYDAWVENNWKDGKDKKINNWKSKLLQTLEYLEDENKPAVSNIPQESKYKDADKAKKQWNDLMMLIKPRITKDQYKLLLDLSIQGYYNNYLIIRVKNQMQAKEIYKFEFKKYYSEIFENKIQFLI